MTRPSASDGSYLASTIGLLLLSAGYLIGCKAPSSYYAGPLSASPRFEEVKADLRGLVVGWEVAKDKSPFVETRWSRDPSVDLELLEVLVGLRQYFTRQGELYLGCRVDLGFANADLSTYPNENTLLILGCGFFGELALRPSISLFSFVLAFRGFSDQPAGLRS